VGGCAHEVNHEAARLVLRCLVIVFVVAVSVSSAIDAGQPGLGHRPVSHNDYPSIFDVMRDKYGIKRGAGVSPPYVAVASGPVFRSLAVASTGLQAAVPTSSSSNCWTRRSISSRIGRTSSSVLPAGSGSSQSR
jgi:hypothetical protein